MKFLTPIILILASLGLFFWAIDPQFQAIGVKRTELAQYTEALGKSKRLRDIRDTLDTKYKSISDTDLDRINKALPDSVDNVRLILDIDSIAGRHGMKIQNIKLSDTPAAAPQTASVLANTSKYGTMSLGFSVDSSYDNFINFLNDLEHSLRIVDITSLSVKPEKTGVYGFDISLNTYWLKQN